MRKALLFMLISTASFSLMNVFIKYLDHIPGFQLVFFRSITSFIFATSYLLSNKINVLGNQRKLLSLRAVAGLISMSLFFFSFKYLSVGTAVSLRYIAPIFAAIFAVFVLKEKLKPIQWLFFFIAFSGVLILKGFDSSMSNLGMTLVITASVFTGMVYILIRKIGKGDHPVVVVNYFMFLSTVVGGSISIFNWVSPQGWDWLLLTSLGVFGYFGQVYMTKAFQTAPTNVVAPIKYTEVVFTIGIGVFWFGDTYTLLSFLGLFLIIGGLVANTLVKKD
ncbi:DMT family transporter [Croceitalea rosinachiae]|uniref:DMT family transporter n=1 Tax=Croceitalea rosinachiae TaxID=3075596 RepID=A0ABU3ADZ8_9FLAO|nr:DMT family transporter [Croceitalea sp. F388]MDT0608411.1 DMT family transporter [Croceitalea sp. F388]